MASKAAQVDFLIAGMLKADATINSAGVVEFFQAQSGSWATPKNAFEEAAKSTPITTLTLDAAGKGTAFCDGVYDIRIKDSDGSTVDSLLEVNFSRPDTSTGVFNIEVITGSSNVALDGDEDIVIVNTTSNISVTLASSATADGRKIVIKATNASTGTITVKATSPDTLDAIAGATGITLTTQYETLEVIADSSNTVYHVVLPAEHTHVSSAQGGSALTPATVVATTLTANTSVVTDTISEKTGAAGVTIDGVLLKDFQIKEKTVSYTASTIAFVDSDPDTITDSADGLGDFRVGQTVTVSGSASNDGTYTIATVAVGTLTLETQDALAAEGVGASVTLLGEGGVVVGGFRLKDNAPAPQSWPSFSVHRSGNQTNVGTALEKILFDVEVFDTNSDYDKDTNYRFTPTVAGKYLLTAQLQFGVIAFNDSLQIAIYKNGVSAKANTLIADTVAAQSVGVTFIFNANGSTDYFEVFGANGSQAADSVLGAATVSFFGGSRIA